MATNGIVFTAAVSSEIKNKKVEKDDKGYYKVVLGELNAYNESGAFYKQQGIKDFINNQSHALARRLKRGYLKGESNHPEFVPGMTKTQFYLRNIKIDLKEVSHNIREIEIIPTGEYVIDPATNQKVEKIRIEGWIKPAGPYGDALKKDLDDPDANVAFSIRSFTKDTVINGVTVKVLLQIVTWDWVNEPGIRDANKWAKLSREEVFIPIDTIAEESGDINDCVNCGLESKDEKDITNELLVNYNKSNVMTKIHSW